MSETDRQTIALAGAGAGAAMATLLAAGVSHSRMIMLNDEPDYARDLDRMAVTLDVLSLFTPPAPRPLRAPADDCGRVVAAMFNGLSGRVQHIDTPKPTSKRRSRRLRGRSAS